MLKLDSLFQVVEKQLLQLPADLNLEVDSIKRHESANGGLGILVEFIFQKKCLHPDHLKPQLKYIHLEERAKPGFAFHEITQLGKGQGQTEPK